MSEKRFEAMESGYISDKRDKTLLNLYDCRDLLNEQQDTINKQLDQIIELQDKYRILEFNHNRLEKRNKAQYEKIGEQQATIKKLQDLCGESDAENAKLRQEIKKLKEEEKLYAQEILRLNELLKQYQANQDLGGGY